MSDTVHIRLPDPLLSALESAAARRFQTVSEFTRQALLDGSSVARGEGPKSDGKRGCASQTQNLSSQRSHSGLISVAPPQNSAALR
jgi:hypothetical protein